ncbi:unnamed protein product, partial [Didymodactylos carnosus]
IHQVRSFGSNIAINYWLNHDRAVNSVIIDRNTCSEHETDLTMTLDTIIWPKDNQRVESFKSFMYELVEHEKTSFKKWTKEFSKEFDFDLQSNVKIISLFAEFFDAIDSNENGYIEIEEIDTMIDDRQDQCFDILHEIDDFIIRKKNNTMLIDENEDDEMEQSFSDVEDNEYDIYSDDELDVNTTTMKDEYEHEDL